jgi:Phage tail lysozyme
MINGAAVIYSIAGGLIAFSGIKGASLSDTFKAVLTGNLGNLSDTETIAFTSGTATVAGNSSSATSGSDSANLLTAAKYLQSNGYSRAAAAGIAGCIAGESGGDPESTGDGGNGLIAWTPPKAGIVTGNATQDLQTQLPDIIEYNNEQGAGLIAMLNSMTDPVQAADFYSENFERPKVKDSDVRASVAKSIYSQLGGS